MKHTTGVVARPHASPRASSLAGGSGGRRRRLPGGRDERGAHVSGEKEEAKGARRK